MIKNVNGIKVPYDKSTDGLIALLDEEMPVFVVACTALSAKTDISSLKALLSLFENDDPYKRRVVVECLGNHALFYKATDYVLACLDDQSDYVVRTAIDVLVKHRVAQAHDGIIRLLKSKDEITRESAFFSSSIHWRRRRFFYRIRCVTRQKRINAKDSTFNNPCHCKSRELEGSI